jgi:hypothetical protein
MAIYYLEVDDEITSAAARIRDASENRVALVIQGGSRVATSRINFRLLAREGRHHNRRLAIIAADPSVRSLAQTAGLPVFSTVAEYQRAESLRPPGTQPGGADATSDVMDELAASIDVGGSAGVGAAMAAGRSGRVAGAGRAGSARGGSSSGSAPSAVRGSRQRRGIGFGRMVAVGLVGLIAVGGLCTYLLLPSATVILTVKGQPVGPLAMTVKVDPTVTTTDDATNTVPGTVAYFPLESKNTFNATGQNVVDTFAVGTVTFSSADTGRSWAVPAQTQLTAKDGTVFVTTGKVVIPAAIWSPQTVGTVVAPVRAVKAGTAGNVAAGAITKMPNISGNGRLSVTNKSATSGGTHTVTLFVSQADLDAARAGLEADMGASLAAQVADPASAPAGFDLFPKSAQLGPVDFSPDPATLLNQTVTSFDLMAKGTGTATTADLSKVRVLADRKIRAMVEAGHSLVDGSVAVDIGAPTATGPIISVPVTATAYEAPTLDLGELRAAIKGKTAAEARAYLSKYGTADVSLAPFWASTVTGFDFRIDISLVEPAANPSTPTPIPTRPPATPKPTPRPTASPGPSGQSTPTPAPPTPTPAGTPTPTPTPDVTPTATPT